LDSSACAATGRFARAICWSATSGYSLPYPGTRFPVFNQIIAGFATKVGMATGIAHCDHRWRPTPSNAKHVELAKTATLFYCYTAEQTLKSEAGARQWRYQALSVIAQENGYNCIVTGHTASDRAGLQFDSRQWCRWLTSPKLATFTGFWTGTCASLSDFTRAETAQFCQDMQLKVWEDSTNQDLKCA